MLTEVVKVLIWGKTYPELSSKYIETVCTGGVRENGSPIRLYPVPLRYLKTGKPYRLYDWIEAPITKSTRDPRPESYKVEPDKIRVTDHLGTDTNWAARRSVMFKDPDWQFDSFDALDEVRKNTSRSMGVVKPSAIEEVVLKKKPPGAEREYTEKLGQVHGQRDLFHPQYKDLQFLPYTIRLKWRCRDTTCSCQKEPHVHPVLDWGLLELARRNGWPQAVQKLRDVSDLKRKDFRLILGNFRLRQWQFGVIGLWYPKLQTQLEQQELFT
jgi:hypothetical protein